MDDIWNEILGEISEIERKKEHLIFIGDMNRHLGKVISGSREGLSYGGKQLINLLESGKYALVNSSEVTIGGPYTRYDPSDPENEGKKSILDLCIVSNDLLPHVESLTIDKEKRFTPYRVVGHGKVVYTDHYSLKLHLQHLSRKRSAGFVPQKPLRWN